MRAGNQIHGWMDAIELSNTLCRYAGDKKKNERKKIYMCFRLLDRPYFFSDPNRFYCVLSQKIYIVGTTDPNPKCQFPGISYLPEGSKKLAAVDIHSELLAQSYFYLLTGDRCQARHFCLAKQFCFLDADCLVVGESQGSSRRSVGKYPVKLPRPEGDSQTIGTYRCRNH